MLKLEFTDLVEKFTDDQPIIKLLWVEIEKQYSGSKRFYHNLSHLENLLKQLTEVKDQVADWDTTLFSLFYHDIIYKASRNDNEEKSAEFVSKRLRMIACPEGKIELCISQILATKVHSVSGDNDTNLFTDADLSILGQDWPVYSQYFKQVRKEYSIYPDVLYKPERKKVLNHFLGMSRIFKTDWFCNKYEERARLNLKQELKEL